MAEAAGGATFTDAERAALAERRWAICVSTFYAELAERLVSGAMTGFDDGGVDAEAIDRFEVPGAFELPLAAKLCVAAGAAQTRRGALWLDADSPYAGVACLGVVIRGETDHYDLVCREAARGIQSVALQTGVPCAFGVVTCDTMEQALARADGSTRDQGHDAAMAVMRLSLLSGRLGSE